MIKTNVELQPFTVPNYAIVKASPGLRQDGFQETPKYPLCDLDVDTLDALCRQFRFDVFRKALKTDPQKVVAR